MRYPYRMVKTGENIDSWCGNCKMILAHTIEAVAKDKPARVHCNTCQAQHTYKAQKPGTSTRVSKPRPTQYEKLLNGKDVGQAKRYSTQGHYSQGDVVDHPMFGVGVTIAIKDATKIEVAFPDGVKVLVHGR